MTSQTPSNPGSFTERFNENVDYARNRGAATGMGRPNVAQTQADAQAEGPNMTTSTDTSGAGVLGGEDQISKRTGEAQTSIDSTNAGADHRRTSYSFTAASLAHATESTGPEE